MTRLFTLPMTTWVFVAIAWLFAATVIALWVYAAGGGRSLWLHTHLPAHRRRMKRAALCMEGAEHFGYLKAQTWVKQAFWLCETCGCPPDLWPARLLKVVVGVT